MQLREGHVKAGSGLKGNDYMHLIPNQELASQAAKGSNLQGRQCVNLTSQSLWIGKQQIKVDAPGTVRLVGAARPLHIPVP